jgi:hypothetical protein
MLLYLVTVQPERSREGKLKTPINAKIDLIRAAFAVLQRYGSLAFELETMRCGGLFAAVPNVTVTGSIGCCLAWQQQELEL